MASLRTVGGVDVPKSRAAGIEIYAHWTPIRNAFMLRRLYFFFLPCYYMCVMLMCTRAYVVPTSSAEYEDGLMPRSLVCNVGGKRELPLRVREKIDQDVSQSILADSRRAPALAWPDEKCQWR